VTIDLRYRIVDVFSDRPLAGNALSIAATRATLSEVLTDEAFAGMIETAPAVFRKYGINSPLLIAHVMAQISHDLRWQVPCTRDLGAKCCRN